jgi:uncharacterized protein YukE
MSRKLPKIGGDENGKGRAGGSGGDGGLSGRSDDTCDQNPDKLSGFQTHIPLYNLYTGKNLDYNKDIVAKNDQIRGVDYGKLSRVADELSGVAADFAKTRDEVDTKVSGVVGSSWQGDAATAFGSYLRQFGTKSQEIDTDLGKLSQSITSTTAAAKKIVDAYGQTIDKIDWSSIQFDSGTLLELILIHKMETGLDDLVNKLKDGLGDLIGFSFPGGWAMDAAMEIRGTIAEDAFLSMISGLVKAVLDPGFTNPFEQNLQLLTSGVQTTDAGIKQAFQDLITTSESINQSPFSGLSQVPDGSQAKTDDGTGKPPHTYPIDTPAAAWTAPSSTIGSYDEYASTAPTDQGSFSGSLFDSAPSTPAATSLAAAAFAPTTGADSHGTVDHGMVSDQGQHHQSGWDTANAGAPGTAGVASMGPIDSTHAAARQPMMGAMGGGGQGTVEDQERTTNAAWRTPSALFDDSGQAGVARMNGVLDDDTEESAGR